MSASARRVLLVGWDAADWKLINPLLDSGRLPTLERIVTGGAMGDCASLVPSMAAMTWTSVVTGVRADRHGILAACEVDPVSGDWAPTSVRGRTVKALWNIATQAGLRSIVVNQAASYPAEPILGVCVDERITSVGAPLGAEWPMVSGCVHPPEMAADLAELRLHPQELHADDLLAFIPGLAHIDTTKDSRPALVADGLAATVTVHSIATELLERESWQFAAIRYHLLEPLSQVFMRYRPPLLDGIAQPDAQAYGGVVDAGYILLDAMLGRLIEIAGPDTMVILVSDHGFQSGEGRPSATSTRDDPVFWHRPVGIVAAAGPGVRPDQLIHGASLLDITPTVLALLGLQMGADMPGRILAEAFETIPEVGSVASWESIEGECGRHAADAVADAWQSHAAIRELMGLGYAEMSPAEEQTQRVAAAQQDLNRAYACLDARDIEGAIVALRRVTEVVPDHLQAILLLASSLMMQGARQESQSLASRVAEHPGLAPYASLLLGLLATSEGLHDEAIAHFAEAERQGGPSAYLLINLAWAHLSAHRLDEAERIFRSVNDIEPESPLAALGLSLVHSERGNHAESADKALEALGLRYFWPEVHAQLGMALVRLGQTERAITAFETSLAQRPSVLAHEWLTVIHERVTRDASRAAAHRASALSMRRTQDEARAVAQAAHS